MKREIGHRWTQYEIWDIVDDLSLEEQSGPYEGIFDTLKEAAKVLARLRASHRGKGDYNFRIVQVIYKEVR